MAYLTLTTPRSASWVVSIGYKKRAHTYRKLRILFVYDSDSLWRKLDIINSNIFSKVCCWHVAVFVQLRIRPLDVACRVPSRGKPYHATPWMQLYHYTFHRLSPELLQKLFKFGKAISYSVNCQQNVFFYSLSLTSNDYLLNINFTPMFLLFSKIRLIFTF